MDDLGYEKAGLGGMVAGDLEWRRGRQAGQRIHMACSPDFWKCHWQQVKEERIATVGLF